MKVNLNKILLILTIILCSYMLYKYSLANPIIKEFVPNTGNQDTTYNRQTQNSNDVTTDNELSINKNGYLKGNKDATLIFIEYLNLSCEDCGKTFEMLARLQNNNSSDMAVVYRHYVSEQDEILPDETAECVGKVEGNKSFWDFVSQYYIQSNDFNSLEPKADRDTSINNILSNLNLNIETIDECVKRNLTSTVVEENTAMGKRAGVTSAPGVVLYDTNTEEAFLLSPIPDEDKLQNLISDRTQNK